MHTIIQSISEIIKNKYELEEILPITPAPKPELGEYCINVFPLAKGIGKAPHLIAEEIASELEKQSHIFRSASATGGYVNFFLTGNIWNQILGELTVEPSPACGKTIVVDYIGANAGKPLHIGHICTPSIGQALCNLWRHQGYRVIGDSHFGDWGGIFGKLIWSYKNLRKYEENTDSQSFLNHLTIDDILSLYQAFHSEPNGTEDEKKRIQEERENGARAEFKKLVSGDRENTELWKIFTSMSIIEIEQKLDLLNVHATYNIGESFYEGIGLPRPNNEDYPDLQYTMKDIVRELLEKGIATANEDGSVGVIFSEESKLPSCILQKKDGTGLYLTSDLAAIKYRLTNSWNPEKIIYSVDVRQQLHLRQAFAIAKMAWGKELGTDTIEFFHAFNGFIKLKEGAMSTRHGTVIFLEKLLEEGFERTQAILSSKGRMLSEGDIRAITVGAIKYSYLGQDREKDVTFDWDKALNFEGNSGPYIQYAYVRARKILRESGEAGISNSRELEGKITTHDTLMIRSMRELEKAIDEARERSKPHLLAIATYDLAVATNAFYVHTPKIREESDDAIRAFRLQILKKCVQHLERGFELLGIKMPTEM